MEVMILLCWPGDNLLPRLQNSIDQVCSRLMDDLQNIIVNRCSLILHVIVVTVEILLIGRYVIVILEII